MGPKPKDYTGEKFGKLTAIEYVKDKNGSYWICECECGNTAKVRPYKIKNNLQTACRSCTSSRVSVNKNRDIPHYGFKKRLYREYKQGAFKRGLLFNLSEKRFFELLEGNCNYCGESPIVMGGEKYMDKLLPPLKRNGIDRVDTKCGYTNDNCVSCCSKCNYAKHEMSLYEFKEWINKVYNSLVKEGSTTIPKGSTLQA